MNLYMKQNLSVIDLKRLFPPVLYKNADQLSEHLTASLLLDRLELPVDGSFSGEMVFWLKLLSTPIQPQLQLEKIQFKRNVCKAYQMFVEPELQLIRKTTPRSKQKLVSAFEASHKKPYTGSPVAPTTVFSAHGPGDDNDCGNDDISDGEEGGSFNEDVFKAHDNLATEAMEEAVETMNDTKTTSSVVATPLQPMSKDEVSEEKSSTPNTVQFKCHDCGKLFLSVEKLQEHKFAHHSNIYKYKCPERQCPVRTKTASAMREHVECYHNEIEGFPCDLCTHTCKTKNGLETHKSLVHQNSIQKGYIGSIPISWCSECGIPFFKDAIAQKHCKHEHLPSVATPVPTNASKPGQLQFKCSGCDIEPSHDKTVIDRHLASAHEGTAMLVAEFVEDSDYILTLLKCEQCEFTTTSVSGLKCHIRRRHQRVVRRCELCDYKTLHMPSLSIHMSMKHGQSCKKNKAGTVITEPVRAVNEASGWGSGIVAAAAAEAEIPIEASNSTMDLGTEDHRENETLDSAEQVVELVLKPADQSRQVIVEPTDQEGHVILKLADQQGQTAVELMDQDEEVTFGSPNKRGHAVDSSLVHHIPEEVELEEVIEETIFIDQVVEETVVVTDQIIE